MKNIKAFIDTPIKRVAVIISVLGLLTILVSFFHWASKRYNRMFYTEDHYSWVDVKSKELIRNRQIDWPIKIKNKENAYRRGPIVEDWVYLMSLGDQEYYYWDRECIKKYIDGKELHDNVRLNEIVINTSFINQIENQAGYELFNENSLSNQWRKHSTFGKVKKKKSLQEMILTKKIRNMGNFLDRKLNEAIYNNCLSTSIAKYQKLKTTWHTDFFKWPKHYSKSFWIGIILATAVFWMFPLSTIFLKLARWIRG